MVKRNSSENLNRKAKRTVTFYLSSQVVRTIQIKIAEEEKILSTETKEEEKLETSFEFKNESGTETESEEEHCLKNYGCKTFSEALNKIFSFEKE